MPAFALDPTKFDDQLKDYTVIWHSFKPQGQMLLRPAQLAAVFHVTSGLDQGTSKFMVCTEEALDAALDYLGKVVRGEITARVELARGSYQRKADTLHNIFSAEARALRESIQQGKPVQPVHPDRAGSIAAQLVRTY